MFLDYKPTRELGKWFFEESKTSEYTGILLVRCGLGWGKV